MRFLDDNFCIAQEPFLERLPFTVFSQWFLVIDFINNGSKKSIFYTNR